MYEHVKTGCKHIPPSEQPLQFQSRYFLNKPRTSACVFIEECAPERQLYEYKPFPLPLQFPQFTCCGCIHPQFVSGILPSDINLIYPQRMSWVNFWNQSLSHLLPYKIITHCLKLSVAATDPTPRPPISTMSLIQHNTFWLQSTVAHTLTNVAYVLTSVWPLPCHNMCSVLFCLLAVLSIGACSTGVGSEHK